MLKFTSIRNGFLKTLDIGLHMQFSVVQSLMAVSDIHTNWEIENPLTDNVSTLFMLCCLLSSG